MIQEKIFEIIAYLLGEIKNNKKLGEIDLQNLKNLGYSNTEINTALGLIFLKLFQNEKVYDVNLNTTTSFRVLSETEKKLITTNAYGYLLELLNKDIIYRSDMENIIERISSIGHKINDEDEMKIITSNYLADFNSAEKNWNRIIINTNDRIN